MVAMYLDGGFLSPLTLKEDDKLLSLIPEDRPRDKLDMTNRSVADLALKLGVLWETVDPAFIKQSMFTFFNSMSTNYSLSFSQAISV